MDNEKISTIERITALIEEQSLTKEQLVTYLRQMMEIRALENNIANLLKLKPIEFYINDFMIKLISLSSCFYHKAKMAVLINIVNHFTLSS